jgi:hypothetical protein
MECGISADTHFGPRVLPCRREFDFTLLFEQAILALTPDLLFLILCLFRLLHLLAVEDFEHVRSPSTSKMVGLPFASVFPDFGLKANLTLGYHAGVLQTTTLTEDCPPRSVVFAARSKNEDVDSIRRIRGG